MNFEPKSKPISIRIVSGGREHASLQSLLEAFSPDDVLDSLPQIINKQWLVKQEGGQAIADQIAASDFSEKTEETYWRLYCVFFNGYIKSNNITSLRQLYVSWVKTATYKSNYELLHHAIMGRGWKDRFFLQSYHEYKKGVPTDKWETIFRELIDIHQREPKSKLSSDVYLELGIILLEKGEDEGIDILVKAHAEGNKDAGNYYNMYLVNQYLKVSDGFCDFYEKHNIITSNNYKGWKEYAKTCRNYRGKIIWYTGEYIHTVLKEQTNYGRIERSINEIYDNRDNKQIFGREAYSYFEKFDEPVWHFWNPDNESYLKIFRRLAKVESPVFLEIRFFCAVMCLKLQEKDVEQAFVGQYHSVGNAILTNISSLYKPAKYLLSNHKKNEILDKIEFRRLVESPDSSLTDVMYAYIPLMAKLV